MLRRDQESETAFARSRFFYRATLNFLCRACEGRLHSTSPRPLWEKEEGRSQHLLDPVVRVVRPAVLDVDQLLAHAHRNGASRAAADEEIAARRAHLADRRDDGGRAAGEGFLQLAAGGILAPLLDG